jgi:hypothetical protein
MSGQQLTLPGLETKEAAIARMLAALPLNRFINQQPCDVGLFAPREPAGKEKKE